MKPFAFRQRVGNLNWKAISSIDLEAIIDDNQIEELQSIIDDVIFSEIKNHDIKGTSITELKKLIHAMQLMLEYLLYCQESQLQLVHELYSKNKKLKKLNQELIQEHESAKEDIRIYKRQINLLKASIEKYKQMVLKNDGYVAVAPRIFNPLSPEEGSKGDKQQLENTPNQLGTLVESMLRHERQTRDFVKEILEEQRSSLLREFDRMAAKSDTDRMNSLTFEQQLNSYVDRITQKIERIAVTAAKTALQSLPQSPSPPPSIGSEKNEMEFRMMDILTRERRLAERERELQTAMMIQNSSRQDPLPTVPPPRPQIRSIGINTAPLDISTPSSDDVYRKGIILASHILARKTGLCPSLVLDSHWLPLTGDTKQLQDAFKKWKNKLFRYTLKLNRSFLEQQDATTSEIIELRKRMDQMSKEHHREIQRYKETTQQLEKRLATQHSKSPDRIVIPAPVVTVTEVIPKKKKIVEYDGPDEIQLMADALLRIQQSVATVEVSQ
jgi:hypothetical protein